VFLRMRAKLHSGLVSHAATLVVLLAVPFQRRTAELLLLAMIFAETADAPRSLHKAMPASVWEPSIIVSLAVLAITVAPRTSP